MNADGLDGDSSDRRQDLGPRCHFRLLTLRLFRFLSFHGWMIGHGPSSFSTPMVLSTFTCLIHSTFHALLSFVSTCWPYLKFLSKRHLASPRKVPFDSAICWFVSAKRKFKNAKKKRKNRSSRRHWHIPATGLGHMPGSHYVSDLNVTHPRHPGSFPSTLAGAAVTTITNPPKSDLVYYP